MRYLGGKSRYGKAIASMILDRPVYEPFCGSLWVTAWLKPVIASDINEDLIILYQAILSGHELPDVCSEEDYDRLKDEDPSPDRTFIGYTCSYAGKFFNGYARGDGRNWCQEGKVALLSKLKACHGTVFRHQHYLNTNYVGSIYCDPPYKGTTGYDGLFDTDTFWKWCNEQVDKGCKVYVSEYIAPSNWTSLWTSKHFNNIDKGSKETIEHLFVREDTMTLTDQLLSL